MSERRLKLMRADTNAADGSAIAMKPIIISSQAHLDDQAAMAQFLAPIPNAAELAKVLAERQPITTRAFEDEAFTARFVASDGNLVRCHTIPDITIDQAEMIAVACEGTKDWSEQAFRAVVETVLGDNAGPPP